MAEDHFKYNEIAQILKALAHLIRLSIVKSILDQGQCNVGSIQSYYFVNKSIMKFQY